MKKNRIISVCSILFLVFSLFTSFVGASDTLSDVPTEEVFYNDSFPNLPPPLYDDPSDVVSIFSPDGTTLFEDLIMDDEIPRNPYITLFADVITDAFLFKVYIPGDVEGRPSAMIGVNRNFASSIEFLKLDHDGVLTHAIKVATFSDTEEPLSFVYYFDDLTIDTIQGFSAPSFSNGLYCAPSWNVDITVDGLSRPGYFAEQEQVYYYKTFLAADYDTLSTPDIYAIPTYAGRTQIRSYITDSIRSTTDIYTSIKEVVERRFYTVGNYLHYQVYSIRLNTGNTLGSVMGWSTIPGQSASTYCYSPYLDHGPFYTYDLVKTDPITERISLPKYYYDPNSCIIIYTVSDDQYAAYISSGQNIQDQLNQNKQEYEKSSDRLADANKQLSNINKPDISDININITTDAELGIASFSDIIGVIFLNSQVSQMLMISLTFVLVAYILFGKR